METYLIYLLISLLLVQIVFFVTKSNKYKFNLEMLNLTIQNLEKELVKQEQNIVNSQNFLEKERQIRFNFEKNNELLIQQLSEQKIRMNEWEILKEKSIEHAKAAIFEVGGKLSSKLLEDHKREAETSSQKNQLKFQETSEMLNKQFDNIVKSVIALSEQVKDSKQTVDIVKQALLSPGGAGNLAEITLENILKNSGLIAGTDYIMQYSFASNGDGCTLRPDAVIFLPGDNLMIIDSKASKFYAEIASLQEMDNVHLKEKLAISMRNHLKQLTSKNYQDEIRSETKSKKSFNHISMVMFLPSESALETLNEADNEFLNKAWEKHIYPAGPIGLVNILSHAKFQIMQNKQIENYNVIIDEVNSLLGNLFTLYEHARKLGISLQSASSNFDKFAGTFNSKIVGKAKKLAHLGIISKNKKSIPDLLERYQIISADKFTLIEGEVEEDIEIKELV